MATQGPGDKYAFDIEIAQRAAKNWKARQPKRRAKIAAIDKGDYTKAESKQRLAWRVNRLLGATAAAASGTGRAAEQAKEALATGLPGLAEATALPEIRAEDITNGFVERVIGQTRDFLMVGFFDKGTVASRAVCRIVTRLGGQAVSYGTGFLVSPSLLMTNHHVLGQPDDAERSAAEFNYQLSGGGALVPVETFTLVPKSFFLTDGDLDFALVAVAPRSANGVALASFGYCPLIGAEGKIIIGDPVNIIQHPKGEPKQAVIRENRMLDLPDRDAAPLDKYAHYAADTEPGSSGSPVFNDQWEVVALHHSGVPRTNAQGQTLDRDGKVWPPNGDPDQIDWVANEGIRTSRLVDFIRTAPIQDGARQLHKEFLAICDRHVIPTAQPPSAPPPRPESVVDRAPPAKEPPAFPRTPRPRPAPSAAPGTLSLMVPLTVTLCLGPSDGAATAVVAAGATPSHGTVIEPQEDHLESIRPDPDYSRRPGYDPDFLALQQPVPLPTPVGPTKDLVVPVGDGIELKYYHYSVIMNSARKLAFVSAVNLDVGAKFHPKREGKDRWFYDDRISHDLQAGPDLYADNPLDCGHLTRRQDAAWGDSEKAATLANDDTFHWTNCSPQHEIFNQSSKASSAGLLLWGNLEMYVTAQAKKDRRNVTVFNGPVFRDNDRVYRGVQLPREYWKLIVYIKDDESAGAVAFVLSQESLIKNLPAEEFTVGPYQPYQVRIADLEKRTNLDFGALASFDRLHGAAAESFVEGARSDVVSIASLGDIVI